MSALTQAPPSEPGSGAPDPGRGGGRRRDHGQTWIAFSAMLIVGIALLTCRRFRPVRRVEIEAFSWRPGHRTAR